MGQHNDSITSKVSQDVKEAAHETTEDIIAILAAAGMNVKQKIDFHPTTGEVRMTPKTVKAIQLFKAEMHEKGIQIDKIMYEDDMARSGYYITKGRKVKNGIIVSEGEVIGFVQIRAVAGQVQTTTRKDNKDYVSTGGEEAERSDTASGVLV